MKKWFIHSTVVLLVALSAALAFMVSPWGLKTSIHLAQKLLAGKLSIENATGSILSPINISMLDYHDKNIHLTIRKAHLEWKLPMLLLGKIHIQNLEADHIDISQHSSTKDNNDDADIPLRGISIERAKINHIAYQDTRNKQAIVIKELSADHFNLSRKKIAGKLNLDLVQPVAINNQMTLSGSPKHYNIKLISRYANEKLNISVIGNQQLAHLVIHDSSVYNGTIRGTIDFSWHPYIQWKTALELRDVPLANLNPSLPTVKNANIMSTGSWKEKPVFNINAKFYSKGSHIDIEGKYDTIWNLKWFATIDDLSELYRPYTGKITTQGNLNGSELAPVIKGKIHAADISIRNFYARSLDTNFSLDLSLDKLSTLSLDASDFQLPGKQKIEKLSFDTRIEKALSQINATLSVTRKNQQAIHLSTRLSGELADNHWKGSLLELKLSSEQAGDWSLAGPSLLDITPQNINVTRTCLLQEPATLCADIHWDSTKPWSIDIKSALTNLDVITQFVNPNLHVDTPTRSKISVSGEKNQLQKLKVTVESQPGQISYQQDLKNYIIPIKKIMLNGEKSNDDFISQATITTQQGDYINTKLTLPDIFSQKNIEQKIDGAIQLKISNLEFVESLLPVISNIKGSIEGDISAKGLLSSPDIQGHLSISNGDINIPQVKVALNDITLNLKAKNQRINYEVNAKTGANQVTLTGQSHFENKKLASHLKLSGENLLISNTPGYTIYASPDLTADIIGHDIKILGSIFVPKAIIKPVDFSKTTSLPNDIEIIGGNVTDPSKEWRWLMDVKVTLGKDITIDSHGLKGHVVGSLKLTRAEKQPAIVATGELNLKNASFSTQGKKLSITPNSNINYTHDLISNPHLDIRAYRTVTTISTNHTSPVGEKTQVGIAIQGTIKEPKISLFSSPLSLSQADIISYLLLDQPATGGNTGSLSLLIQAVSNLKLTSQGNDFSLSQLKQTFNITELGIQQQTYIDGLGTPMGINQSSFVIGTRITPKIYLKYNHGLMTDINIYQARYLFNDSWSLQLETYYGNSNSSNGSGVDILYTVSPKKLPW